ncbi:MAG: HEAT repeat domain-containing protein [Chthonomonas sp.]|nr:HEAT repeat domain-containing protein [Chthonomonas sp.]
MITSAALALFFAAQQGQLQTMVGGEMVNVSLPTAGYVFPGRTHEDHRENALGRVTGPAWTWSDFSGKLATTPAGKTTRILVILQMRAEMVTMGTNGRKFPNQATLEREDVADLRDGLALAGQIIRVQSGGAVTPVFDIHLDSSVAPLDASAELYPWRMNRMRFDPEDAPAVEGYDMAWVVWPRSQGPDRLQNIDLGPRTATLGYWTGDLPMSPRVLAADFARAWSACNTKIEAAERMRSGLEVPSGEHRHDTAAKVESFVWNGQAEGSFGDKLGEISEASGRRNGRLCLMSRSVGAPVGPMAMTLRAKATGNAEYFVAYSGPGNMFEIVGWMGPEARMPKSDLGIGILTSAEGTVAMTLPPSKFPVSEIILIPGSEGVMGSLREPATLTVSDGVVTVLNTYTGFPVSASDVLTALNSTDLSLQWEALERAKGEPETADVRAKVLELFRSSNRTLARAAMECLATWGSVESVAALRAGLDKGPFEHTQGNAATGLRLLIEAKKLDPLVDLTMIDDAAALIANRDWRTRKAAAQLLALVPKENANIAMLLMLGDPEPEVRLTAIAGANLNIELVNQRLLYYAVNDPYEAVRTAAYTRLLSSPKNEIRKEAETFMADDSPFVVQGVLMGTGPVTPALMRQAIVNPLPDTQAAALEGCFKRKIKVEPDWVKHLASTNHLPTQMAMAKLVSGGLLNLPQSALQHLMSSPSQGVKDTLAGSHR